MNPAQYPTLAAALRAETNPDVVAAVAIRNDTFLQQWCNTNGATLAWNPSMSSKEIFEAGNILKYDNITQAGKREAWRMILQYAPHDMSRNKMRIAVVDVWGATESVAVLQSCRRLATNGEIYLGYTTVVENTVSAAKLTTPGYISLDDVSNSLNAY